MRKICVFLALALLMLASRANFYDLSLSVVVRVNINGSVHVTERVYLALDPSSEDPYNRSIYSRELTIMDWQQITQSQYLRQHIFSTSAARNLKIVPENMRQYSLGNMSTATIKLDYDLDKVVLVNQTGPRTLSYSFNKSALSFEPSPSGQVLPKDNELTIMIPPDSVVTALSPEPYEPPITRDYMDRVTGVSNFTWMGTIPLMDFELVFTREEPIDVEVRRFFEDLESTAVGILLSPPGFLLMLLVLVAIAYLALVKR